MNIYIDNSRSMKNNISLDSLNMIVSNIVNYSTDNYVVDRYLFGDSVRIIKEGISLEDATTDFKSLKNFIVSNNADQNLLISDGLNYLNSDRYNSYQAINTLGVGLIDRSKRISIQDAKIKNNLLTYRIDWINTNYDTLHVDFRDSNDIISSKSLALIGNNGSYIDTINIEKNNLDSSSNLNVGLDIEDDNVFDNYAIILNDYYSDKSVSLLTGVPSLNTRYIKQKLKYLNNNIIHTVLDDKFNIDYRNSQLVVFDNYPSNLSEIDNFEYIVEKLNINKVPFIIIFGNNQDYSVINRISDKFNFSISNQVDENLVFEYNDFYDNFNLSNSVPPTSYYKIISKSRNPKNIYYSNGSPAVLFENQSMLVFCPDLSRISYKLSNSSNTFDDFFQFLFKQSYYQSDHIRIFVDRDQFYNNERINIDLVDNSKIAYNDLLLKIKDSNSNLYSQYSIREDEINGYAIPPISQPGEYSLYLLNKNQKVSNKLTVDIYKYDNEDILKGQNVDYLNRIANQTNGAYSNEYDYLRNLVNNAINYRVSYSNDIYDVKNYLLGLLFAVFALVVDWYLRKKRGLL